MANPTIIVGNDTVLVQADEQGNLYWNRNADKIIADDSYWVNANLCFRIMFKILWNVQSQPALSKTAFEQLQVAMPGNMVPDSPEWNALFSWKIWEKGVSFGSNNINPPSFQLSNKLTSELEELSATLKVIELKLNNDSPILGDIVPYTNKIIAEITETLKEMVNQEIIVDKPVMHIATEDAVVIDINRK